MAGGIAGECLTHTAHVQPFLRSVRDVRYQRSHGKLRPYVSFLEYGRHVGQLRRRRRRRRRRAYASTSDTASQDNHEKINS